MTEKKSYGSVLNNSFTTALENDTMGQEVFHPKAEEPVIKSEDCSDGENGDGRVIENNDSQLSHSSGTAIMSLQVGTSHRRLLRKENRKSLILSLRRYKSEQIMNVKDSESDFMISPSKSVDKDQKYENVPEKPTPIASVLHGMLIKSYINILLVFIPFAIASNYLDWSPTAVFVLNFLAMIPLAAMLGDFTEEAAAHTNQTIGGLINASFGNAVEVVVAIQAMLSGQYRVVQASMIGSIFSNLLLVLGCCFLFGGLNYDEQKYSQLVATSNLSLLGLSCIALVLPTPIAEYYDVNDEEVLFISRIAAVFLIAMYLQLLYFQLKTHHAYFQDEEEEPTTLPFSVAIIGLLSLTLLIALLSEFLVESIDGFCEESGISKTFTGLIILPIVGNAVEHMTAVSVAMKNKMDLAMGGKFEFQLGLTLVYLPYLKTYTPHSFFV